MGSGALQSSDMPEPSPPDKYYGEAEVIAALEALTDTDISRLVDFARYRFPGADPDDLVSEAIMQTLALTRKWKRGVTMRNHLIGCMRSNASNRYKQAQRNIELPSGLHDPSAAADIERAHDAWRSVERLRQELEHDATAQDVLNAVFYGLTPKEACELLHMRRDVYDAAKKRIRRLADKLKEIPHA